MNVNQNRRGRLYFALVVSILLGASVACGGFGGPDGDDIEATQAALEATQAALSTQAAEVLSQDRTPTDEEEEQTPATEGDSEVIVTNDSADAICFLYVSSSTSDDWGEDRLGESGIIDSGDSFIVYDLQDGTYDIMAEMCDGEQVIDEAVTVEGEFYWSVYDIGASEEYWVVTDDYNSIQLEAPLEWWDYEGGPWYDSGDVVGAEIIVSPDVDGFLETWNTPGVIFSASDDLADLAGYQQLLNLVREDFMNECEYDDRYDYEDSLYRGKYDIFNKCGGLGGADLMVLSAVSIDDQYSYLILVQVQMVSEEDWDIAQHILDTFQVIGELP